MSLSSFVRAVIPPPQYLQLPSAGVDISDTSLKYIVFKPHHYHHSSLKLTDWGDIGIPADTLARGEIKNHEQLVQVLKEAAAKLSTPYVRVSLPEERAYLFETSIKRGTPLKEIRGLLEFRLEENVPLSPRDAFFDYHIVDNGDAHGPLTVSVTVYARETIMGYYEAARAANLIPVSFEVEAQAIARATIPVEDTRTHLIVDFGKTRTGIGVVYKHNLTYTSTIDIGGKELSSALRRQLGNKAEEELTQIKNTQGLVRGAASSDVYDALITTMSAIKDEIAMRIQYWEGHAADLPGYEVASIVVCGGSANLNGLCNYFTETLGVPTVLASVWQNAFSIDDYIPPIDQRHSLGYATAIGLALGQHIHS